MEKVLMKACVNPLENSNSFDVLKYNLIAGNSGNLLYSYALMRTMMSDNIHVDTIKETKLTEKRIDEINQQYSCFVIPLANAFRDDYVNELINLTETVKKLHIPCVVVGVGLQESFEPDWSKKHPFDEIVKDFVCAVLEKSSSIGIRGEITGEYLKRLGIKDFTVIGCPSMYMKGDSIKKKDPISLTEDSTISINASSGMPDKLLKVIQHIRNNYPNHFFIPQELKEFELLYAGAGFPQRFKGHDIYPNSISRDIYQKDRVFMFYNVPSWAKYMEGIDLSFGSRIHGSIMATLEGVPAILVSFDSRTRELAEFHNIPYVPMSEIKDDTSLAELYERTDFTIRNRGHKQRFNAFIQFLDQNNIPHLDKKLLNDKTLFDKEIEQISWNSSLHAITNITKEEMEQRLSLYHEFKNSKLRNVRIKNEKLQKEINRLIQENASLKAELSIPLLKRVVKKIQRTTK